MVRALLRLLLALGGAALAVFLVAIVEARSVLGAIEAAGERPIPGFGSVFAADLGVLFPIVCAVGAFVGVLVVILHRDEQESPLRVFTALREGAADGRLRAAAAIPVAIFGVFGWTVGSAHVARLAMAAGKPAEAGLTVGVGSVGALVVTGAIALACFPLLRRLLSLGGESVPQLLDPALTGTFAVLVVFLLFAIGIFLGDTSGANGGALGIFGVLKRPELDLRPLAIAAVIGAGAVAGSFALSRLPAFDDKGRVDQRQYFVAAGAALLPVVLLVFCVRASGGLGEQPAVVRGIEKHAPLGRNALALLRRLSDRDHDGFSARFGGGDCNDADPMINPGAIDVPGNGLDEDCSGADTPIFIPEPTPVTSAAASNRPKRSFNVVLITVDTLRPDLGFMGWDNPTSPNLDALAAKATVFERAYSMASYTGKSVGPMLIGRYPSETLTDFSHFNTYFEANTFVTERLRDAGVRTFAGMCHWYFKNPTGLRQGFDVFDASAIPPGMGDNDNAVTSDRMGDLALRLLKRPENTLGTIEESAAAVDAGVAEQDGGAPASADGGSSGAVSANTKPHRFFAWFHFFDPHAQYVSHEGAPEFHAKGNFASSRILYDQEIWYTDKHIGRVLDYIASQPWAEDTAIVMTADHGEAFYEHGMMWHGSEIWEELVRVPLFVYVPGAEPRRVPMKRSHIDIAPTILELMGVPLPEEGELRGKSLLADVYLGKGEEHDERDVYIDMPAGPFNGVRRAVITGPSPGMKLIHSGGYNYNLFDLAADPDERKDLSADKEKLQEMIKAMNATRGRLREVEVKMR